MKFRFKILIHILLVLFITIVAVSARAQDLKDDSVTITEDEEMPLPGDESDKVHAGKSFTWHLSGYVENTTNVEYLKEEKDEALLNITRARVNLSGKHEDFFDYAIGVVGNLYAGQSEFNMTRYLPESDRNSLIPGTDILFSYNLENDIYLQEAFGTIYLPYFRLRAGRQKFYTGTGYAYNPTDLFNNKNSMDPTYEVDGIDAVLAAIELPYQTEIQGVIRFSDRFSNSDYLARVKTYLAGWDIAVQYTHAVKERIDYESLNTLSAIGALASGGADINDYTREFRWHFAGGELSGELFGVGINAEGGYAWINEKGNPGTLEDAAKNHARFLVGMDFTFDFQLYIMAEYLYQGQGRTDSSDITFNDRMAYMNGEILSINRDILFAGISYPLADLIDFSLYGIAAINDKSIIINPWLTWNILPGCGVVLSVYVPVGDEESQNGNFGTSGFIRIKYSF